MIKKGSTYEWEVLSSEEDEFYIRRRHLSGAWAAGVRGPYTRDDITALLMVLANELGIDEDWICNAIAH